MRKRNETAGLDRGLRGNDGLFDVLRDSVELKQEIRVGQALRGGGQTRLGGLAVKDGLRQKASTMREIFSE